MALGLLDFMAAQGPERLFQGTESGKHWSLKAQAQKLAQCHSVIFYLSTRSTKLPTPTHIQGEGTDTQVLSELNVLWLSLNSEASSTPAPYFDGENLILKADAVQG